MGNQMYICGGPDDGPAGKKLSFNEVILEGHIRNS
jgi:hypothetical protein